MWRDGFIQVARLSKATFPRLGLQFGRRKLDPRRDSLWHLDEQAFPEAGKAHAPKTLCAVLSIVAIVAIVKRRFLPREATIHQSRGHHHAEMTDREVLNYEMLLQYLLAMTLV